MGRKLYGYFSGTYYWVYMDILIRRATEVDAEMIVDLGLAAVELAHRDSCSAADLRQYLEEHYNMDAIINELFEPKHIYHIMFCDGKPAGFSKVIFNANHPNIPGENATKLDRIYLDSSFFHLNLGQKLLAHNIALSKDEGQSGMWLFTWTGNERAVNFYLRNGFSIIGSHMFKVSETHSNPNHHMYLAY